MNKIWAPWRMKYLQGMDDTDNICVFCKNPAQGNECDRNDLIVHRGEHCFVMLNKYPYTNGHCMVIPCEHSADLPAMTAAATAEMWALIQRTVTVLTRAYSPDGFNIGMNLGRAAGAGIDQHLHMHVVPRWNGDVNFMSVTGETRVISQSLHDTFDALKPYFNLNSAVENG